jgi:hypothetical protein
MKKGKILKGISSSQYEHEFDRKALEALKKTPGLDILIKKAFELGIERIYRIKYTILWQMPFLLSEV